MSTTLTTRTASSRQVPAQQLRRRPAPPGWGRRPRRPAPRRVPARRSPCRPSPRSGAARAVGAGLVHGQPVEAGLLAGHDDVDVVAAAQGVVGHGQQGVGVRRQVDPYDLGALVEDVVDEAGVLVGEAVVVLPPDMRGQQVVEGGDGGAPGQSPGGPAAT